LVSSVGGDTWAHQESEQLMAPFRAERAKAAAKRKAEDAKLLGETLRVCSSVPLDLRGVPIELRAPVPAEKGGGVPTMQGAILPSPGATVVGMGAGTSVTVLADDWTAPHLAERYRESVMQALRAKGSALSTAELDAIRAEYRVLV
jgi:hypothetical protein